MNSFIIAVETTLGTPVLATSAAWITTMSPPRFNYRDLDRLNRHLIATANVQHNDLSAAVNAVIQRTIEKMYIQDIITTTDITKAGLDIVLKPRFRDLNIRGCVRVVRSHWLITAARTLLKEEIRRRYD